MENNPNSSSFSGPQLCTKCCSFYANPQFGIYCSTCYKDLGLAPTVMKLVENFEGEKNVEASLISQELIVKQADHSNCWSCGKRAGMMAYKCKCQYSFCKKHRLAESHSCEFDYINEGKKILAKANPNIQNEKVEKI